MAKPKSICAIEGCDNFEVTVREMCKKHYARWRTHGDPNFLKRTPQGDPLQWLVANSAADQDECLIWPFFRGKTSGGYGQTVFRGKKSKSSRVMCLLAHGDPPTPEHVAAHSCGNGHGGCVNPKHMRWATTLENGSDMVHHGTSTRGPANSQAVLSDVQVREIREMCAAKSVSQEKIGLAYGISQSAVSAINKRKNWAWLT